MLSLYKLEIFATVVEAGSFSLAADRLLMTQSAVSQHIQDVEASLGAQLFNRGRRGVTLTSSGTKLHQYTQQILRLVNEAENAVTDVDKLTEGQVRIGATPGISVYLLPEWIQAFHNRYRNLTATLQTDITGEIISGVLQHGLDIGFIEGEIHEDEYPHLAYRVLQEVQLFVIIGPDHAWWPCETITADMLNRQPFVTRQQRSKTRAWVDHTLRKHGAHPHIVAELDNFESIKRLVISGMGVAILPEYTIRAEVAAGSLRALSIADVPLQRTLKLVWDSDRSPSPVTRAFVEHLSHSFSHNMS